MQSMNRDCPEASRQTDDWIIKQSRMRCVRYGLQPDALPVPLTKLSAIELKKRQVKYSEVLSVVQYFGDKVLNLLEGTPVMIIVTDQLGSIISIFGHQAMKEILSTLGIAEGIQITEREMGTNVVNLALDQKRPFQVVGRDHYHDVLHQSACYCAPFQFKEVDHLSGSIGIMTAADFHSPFILPLLANMVDSMERELLVRQHSRHQTMMNNLMMNTMKNGVMITDAAGKVLEFNPFAEKFTNRPRKMVIGSPVFEFEQFGHYIREVLQNNERFEDIEITFSNAADHPITCLFDAIPIFNDEGKLVGAYAQFRDITERSELEQQIIISEKYSAIGKLGAGLAHEIRNPLTSVMGFIQLMRERSPVDADRRYLDIIYSELESMKHLISDFVLMAKPGSPERKPCLAEDIIKDTVRLMESQANLQNCVLAERLNTSGTIIPIDPIQIKQVLINLIQNAIEAMPQGGAVTIETGIDDSGGRFLILIKDEGPGMTECQMRKIMNPFFTTKQTGLGLGLSTCNRIIENHKGDLTFTSQVTVGTTFIISLPLQ